MNEPKPESIVIDGQWIEIAKAEEGASPQELLRLRDIAKLPFALSSELHHPDTGILLPVPFGNLTAYAEHLAKEWNDDAVQVRILFHRSINETLMLEELMARDKGSQLTDEQLQQAIAEGRAKLLNQDGELTLPTAPDSNE